MSVTLILIDPFTRTVSPIEYDKDKRNLGQLVRDPQGGGSGIFTIVSHMGLDFIVDDEGLYQQWTPEGADEPEPWPAFTCALYPYQQLSGKCIIAGCVDGELVAPPLGVESVALSVRWGVTPAEPRFEILTGDDALKAFGW